MCKKKRFTGRIEYVQFRDGLKTIFKVLGSRIGASRREHRSTDEALNKVLQGENLWGWKVALSPHGDSEALFWWSVQ